MEPRDDLLDALTPVVRAFERLGVEYLVGGSVASAAHGEFRATNDVDLVADLGEEHAEEFALALGDAYYSDMGAIRTAIRQRSSFNLIHLDTMLKVDVYVSRGRPYDVEALRRSVERAAPAAGAEGSIGLRLASPEDIILAKLDRYRAGGETSERQWRDILGVLRVQGASIDTRHLRLWAAELGVADLLERAFLDAAPPHTGDSEP